MKNEIKMFILLPYPKALIMKLKALGLAGPSRCGGIYSGSRKKNEGEREACPQLGLYKRCKTQEGEGGDVDRGWESGSQKRQKYSLRLGA